MKEYASDQSRKISVWPLVKESSRNKKKRKAFKIWTAVPRVEKYKIGAAAVQI